MLELLLLLPALAGIAFFGFGSSGGGADDTPNPNPNTSNPDDTVIEGTSSADALRGSADREFILGGSNADKLEGGGDDDYLLGEAGSDSIFGGVGFDMMLGGAGNDAMFGGRGFDTLIGGAGNDTLQGAEGNDVLAGSSGADKLEGGAGADVISGYDLSPGTTPSRLSLAVPASLSNASLQAGVDEAETVFGTAATADLISRLRAGLSSADASDADDQLFGGRGNDTIYADFSDTITGGQGADQLIVNSNGANEVVTITDLNPAEDTLRIFVPVGTNPAITFVNGATPEIGVTVNVAGDAVARLVGLTAAQIPAGFIQITNT
jgi:Ca2+-binding RTX toxin-like protein